MYLTLDSDWMDLERFLRHGKNLLIYKTIVHLPESCLYEMYQPMDFENQSVQPV